MIGTPETVMAVGSGSVRGQRRELWRQSGRTLFTNSIYYMKIKQVW
ncbi:hypothetical protein CLOSTASPAR_02004 [[Clostridium] asparagiforme DSM 15981]|uniref:Uncharacterized protein n=1 Tax=[Clostridium] asparagiforme DSM 15981 TaxID=518636 RepID=C0CYC8_9FIRM|nr:hypothetical protein CLOSTASPAR_02004 [[Clostridium] asparagiforme DSM 15981]